ncbi:MAG: hypothetical protein ACE5R6_16250 [Candidatus Heimdallarchaeota archaeon]
MPASESIVTLKETEKTILGALMAFGIRSPESIRSHTGLKKVQITRAVDELVKQGLIVKKLSEEGELLVPTPIGLHVANLLLGELTEDLDNLEKNTSEDLSELTKHIQVGFKDLGGYFSKAIEEFPNLVASLVAESNEKLSTLNEALVPLLETQKDIVGGKKEVNHPKERITEVVEGLQSQIDNTLQTLGEFVHQAISEGQPISSLRKIYGSRLTQLLQDSTQTRKELQEQIRQLSKQAEDLAQIDSTLGTICTTLEEAILQGLDNWKDEFSTIVREYATITKQDTTAQKQLVEILHETVPTLSTTNTSATNLLESFSSQIASASSTLKERHSTISTLIAQFLETQGDMKDSPIELTNNQKGSEDQLIRTLATVNSTIDEVLQPTISSVKKTFDELKNQVQEKISKLENIHQQVLDKRKSLDKDFIRTDPTLTELKTEIQDFLTSISKRTISMGTIIPTEGKTSVIDLLQTSLTQTTEWLQTSSEFYKTFTSKLITIVVSLYEDLNDRLSSTFATLLDGDKEKLGHLTDRLSDLNEQLGGELTNLMKSMENATELALNRIGSEITETLERGQNEFTLELEKIVEVQKGLFTIYSKGLKTSIARFTNSTVELLGELKSQLTGSWQQLTEEAEQTLNNIDVSPSLQILTDGIRTILMELGENIISQSTAEFERTLQILEKITLTTAKTVSTTAEDILEASKRTVESIDPRFSDTIRDLQHAQKTLLETVRTNLLTIRDEFAQLVQKARIELEKRADKEDMTISGVVEETREKIYNALKERTENILKRVEKTTNVLIASGKNSYDLVDEETKNLSNLLETKMALALKTTTQALEGFESDSREFIEGLVNKQMASFAETMKTTERELFNKKSDLFDRLSQFNESLQAFLEENNLIINHTIDGVTETLKSSLASLQIDLPQLFNDVRKELEKQIGIFIPKLREDQHLILDFSQKLFNRIEERQQELLIQTRQTILESIEQLLKHIEELRQLIEPRISKIFGRKKKGYDDFTNTLEQLEINMKAQETNVPRSLTEIMKNITETKDLILGKLRIAFDQQLKSSEAFSSDWVNAVTRVDLAYKDNLNQILNKSQSHTKNTLLTSLKRQITQNEELISDFRESLNELIVRQQGMIDTAENIIREVGALYDRTSDEMQFGFQDKLARYAKEAVELYKSSMWPMIEKIQKSMEVLKNKVKTELEKIEMTLDTGARENNATAQAEVSKIRDIVIVELDHMTSEVARTLEETVKLVFGSVDTLQGNVEKVGEQTVSKIEATIKEIINERTDLLKETQLEVSTLLTEHAKTWHTNLIQEAGHLEESVLKQKTQLEQFANTIMNMQVAVNEKTPEIVSQLQTQLEDSIREKTSMIASRVRAITAATVSQLGTTTTSFVSRLEDMSANQRVGIETVEQESIDSLLKSQNQTTSKLETAKRDVQEGIQQSLGDLAGILPKTLQDSVTAHMDRLTNLFSEIRQILNRAHQREKRNEELLTETTDLLEGFRLQVETEIVQKLDAVEQELKSKADELCSELDEQYKSVETIFTEKINETVDIFTELSGEINLKVEEFLTQTLLITRKLVSDQFHEIEDTSTNMTRSTQTLTENITVANNQLENLLEEIGTTLGTRIGEVLKEGLEKRISGLYQKKEALQSFSHQYMEAIEAAFHAIQENIEDAHTAAEEMATNVLPGIDEVKANIQNNQSSVSQLLSLTEEILAHEHYNKLPTLSKQVETLLENLALIEKRLNDIVNDQLCTSTVDSIRNTIKQLEESCHTLNQRLDVHFETLNEHLGALMDSEEVKSIEPEQMESAVDAILKQLTKSGKALKKGVKAANQSLLELVEQIQMKEAAMLGNEVSFSELKQKLKDTKTQLVNALEILSKQVNEIARKTSKIFEEQNTLTKTKLTEEVTKTAQTINEHFTAYKNKISEAQTDVESILQTLTEVADMALELQITG